MTELFEQLLPCKWRDVEFPVTVVKMSLAHDLVEHKYWGLDGARVEATGLAPMRFTASIPFINGIVPGRGERWSVLYPNGMREFLAAFADKKTGFFQHPEFGLIPCKPERLEFTLSGDHRGGMECEASWIETLEDDDVANLIGETPIQDIELAALDLDASDADLKALAPDLPEYKGTLADLARGIQAIADTATILEMTTMGKLDSLVYRAENIGDSVDRAKSALTWQATNSLERIKAHALKLRENLLKDESRDIALYFVPGDTTLAGLLPQLAGAKLGDVIKLNPELMRSAIVPKGATVRYYVSRLAA